jgi:hypothetical protein
VPCDSGIAIPQSKARVRRTPCETTDRQTGSGEARKSRLWRRTMGDLLEWLRVHSAVLRQELYGAAALATIFVALFAWLKWRALIKTIPGTYKQYNEIPEGGEFKTAHEKGFTLKRGRFLPSRGGHVSGSEQHDDGSWRTNLFGTSLVITWADEGETIRATKRHEGFFEGYHVQKGKVQERVRLLKVSEPGEKSDANGCGKKVDEVTSMQVSEKWVRDSD